MGMGMRIDMLAAIVSFAFVAAILLGMI